METISHRVAALFYTATAFAVFTCFSSSLLAQTAGEKVLLTRAQSLAQHGRLDIAVQTWQQVLLSDPGNREALGGIAKAEMQLGRTEEAKAYLSRLKSLGGSDKEASAIESMPRVQPRPVRLRQASLLAQQGKFAEAMSIYRDIYGNDPPAGDIALSYYDTEAALPSERANAVEGLRNLSKQFPADPRYAITLGRILTYDTKTRADGISLLQKYEGSTQAQEALAQAAKWNKTSSNQTVEEVNSAPAKKSAAPNPPISPAVAAMNSLESSAFRALNGGNLPEAERKFTAILAGNPANAQALSGIGYIRMKQGNFGEAADYLSKARQAGASGKGLEDALASARFWNQLGLANGELKSGDVKAASAGYRVALQMKPASPEAAEALAGTLLQLNDAAAAVVIFEKELRSAPSRDTAWRGLILAQNASGEALAAIATSQRIPKPTALRLQNDPAYLLALAQANTATGHTAEAARILQTALALPFANQGKDLPVDEQLQFASLLMMAKRYEPAMQLYRQILSQQPEDAGAWRALVGALHELHRDDDALTSIRRMPQPSFQASMRDSGFLALVASIYLALGAGDKAQTYIERASAINPEQTGLQLQLASIYASDGNEQKALVLYRNILGQNANNIESWRPYKSPS
jgi:cellulose synthase operon protein C